MPGTLPLPAVSRGASLRPPATAEARSDQREQAREQTMSRLTCRLSDRLVPRQSNLQQCHRNCKLTSSSSSSSSTASMGGSCSSSVCNTFSKVMLASSWPALTAVAVVTTSLASSVSSSWVTISHRVFVQSRTSSKY